MGIIITRETAEFAVDRLSKLFPTGGQEPIYSIGYKRWRSLTKKELSTLYIIFNFDTEKIREALQTKTAKELINEKTHM